MSRFKEFLLESVFTVNTAMAYFGLSDGFTEEDLKKVYKQMSLLHHPDRGGSTTEMQKVNDAYKVLQKSIKGYSNSKSFTVDWEAIDKELRNIAKFVNDDLEKKFKPEVFTSYLEELSGLEFEFKKTEKYPSGYDKKSPSNAGFKGEFFTKDRSSVFTITITASLSNLRRSDAGLSGGGYDYSLYVDAYGFHNNRKQKMAQRDWSFTDNHKLFTNPAQVYPRAKLKKIFTGTTTSAKSKAFKKADMYAFLTKKLNGSGSGDDIFIPVGNEYSLRIYRSVFMRKASWAILDLHTMPEGKFNLRKKVQRLPYTSFPETEEYALKLEKIIKGTKRISDEKRLIDYLSKEIEKLKK